MFNDRCISSFKLFVYIYIEENLLIYHYMTKSIYRRMISSSYLYTIIWCSKIGLPPWPWSACCDFIMKIWWIIRGRKCPRTQQEHYKLQQKIVLKSWASHISLSGLGSMTLWPINPIFAVLKFDFTISTLLTLWKMLEIPKYFTKF